VELVELLLEDELELLLDELEELLLEDELELLVPEEEELLLEELDELLLEDELELEELLEVVEVELPVHVGAIKLPSWLPCAPNTLVNVWPGLGNCQLQQLVNWKLVPAPAVHPVALNAVVRVTDSGKVSVTVQSVSAVVPLLVTLTSTWKNVPFVLDGVAVQVCAANA
jgi:hypothetical protein